MLTFSRPQSWRAAKPYISRRPRTRTPAGETESLPTALTMATRSAPTTIRLSSMSCPMCLTLTRTHACAVCWTARGSHGQRSRAYICSTPNYL
nr:MAG TPA: hypothetical protein [Bacteriophage sp.]